MKITRSFRLRAFIAGAALLAGLGFVTHAAAQEVRSYLIDLNSKTATELEGLGGGSTVAAAINDAGQVAGTSQTPDGAYHAFITSPDGEGMRDLGTLGGLHSYASGINDAGQVAGRSYTTSGNNWWSTHAFITGPDGEGMRDLGTLGGSSSVASGINNAGQVVGVSEFSVNHNNEYAFITGPDGEDMRSLGTLRGFVTFASGINNAGQVVGHSFVSKDGPDHAFITGPDGAGMRDLGTLGGVGVFDGSQAEGINDAGQAVGSSHTEEGIAFEGIRHAFITGPGGAGMADLNSLVDLPDGIILNRASDINNMGQVVATSVIPVIPEPKIYAMFLAGLCLVVFTARRSRAGITSSSGA